MSGRGEALAGPVGEDSVAAFVVIGELPWRWESVHFDREFPQFSDTLVAVVRAPTAEEARATATLLARKLAAEPL